MQAKLDSLQKSFDEDLASVTDLKSHEELRIKYLGRKGLFPALFEEFKSLPGLEKPKYGKTINILKNKVETGIAELKEKLLAGAESEKDLIDLTLPGRKVSLGSTHLLTQALSEIESIFIKLGFSVHLGPELESDHNNFEALNFPPDHPAREMQDTFFVNESFVMRTHTSPVQVRLMMEQKPPLRAIMPGKVYRNEAISAKSYCLFHQVEGLYVDKDVTFAELKGTIVAFAKQFYGNDVKYRFRPSFFPFTEPSAEVDIWWEQPGKEGKWLEIMGCGMVDPNVLRNVNIDPEEYTGYAFGMGVERIAMLKYGVSDIRTFFDNDKRFLSQF